MRERRESPLWKILLIALLLCTTMAGRIDIARAQYAHPVISVDPLNSTRKVGETFPINVTIFNATLTNTWRGVYTWECHISFNASILQAVDAMEGPFLQDYWNKTIWAPPSIDNYNGNISLSCGLYDYGSLSWGAVGELNSVEVLANITFQAVGEGSSPLHFYEAKISTYIAGDLYKPPVDTADGSVTVEPAHDVAVISVTAPAEAASESSVPIDVTVKNEGSFTENVNVKIYRNETLIDSKDVTNLAAGTQNTTTFTWSTTGVSKGNYTLNATATISVDNDPTDNFKTTPIRIVEHDVAVIDLEAPTSAHLGDTIPINVTVGNQGSFTETLNVTVSYDGNLIGFNDTVVLPMNKRDMWTGDGEKTTFTTTGKPVVSDSEKVYVNETLMSKPANYTIDYEAGDITFTTAPGEGANVTAKYVSKSTIVPFSWNTGSLGLDTYTVNATATIPVDDDPTDDFMTKEVTLELYNDVAVISIEAPDYAHLGDSVPINVTVKNEGDYEEEVNVEVSYYGTYNSSTIGSENVTLTQGQNKTANFTWYTTSLRPGSYLVEATASINNTDMWAGNGAKKSFVTTRKPVVPGSEQVYVNQTLKTKPADYTIDYEKGEITFTTAPGNGAEIKAIYFSAMDDDPGDNDDTKAVIIRTHDMKVTSITAPSHGYRNSSVPISVTVRNEGWFREAVNVTLQYDTVLIGFNDTIELGMGSSITVSFTWYTTSLTFGNYSLTANATVLPSDTNAAGIDDDPGDNTLDDVTVFITIPGDANGDGMVDDLDLSDLKEAYGSESGDPNWATYAYCDFKGDNKVDALDLFDLSKNYGETV